MQRGHTGALGNAVAAIRGPAATAFLPGQKGTVVTVTPRNTDLDEPKVLNPGRLWAGGVATAVVAGLIVVVGVYIARGILGIAVLAPSAAGSFGTSATVVYAVFAAACALAATGVLHLLLLGAPQPMAFFNWIAGLGVLVAVTAPFGQSAALSSKVFTAIINLIVGVAVISLLNGVARSAVQPLPPVLSDAPDEPPTVPGQPPPDRWPGTPQGTRWPGESQGTRSRAEPGGTESPGQAPRARWPGESDRMRWRG